MMNNPWQQTGVWEGGTVSAVAISPQFETDRLVLVATLAGIYRSTDGGRRWRLSVTGLDDLTTQALVFAPVDRAGSLTAFAATQQGRLYHSPDGGLSWEPLRNWRYGVAAALAISPNYTDDGTLFVATAGGIFRSFDRGLKWQSADFGLLDTDVLAIACAPNFAASELLWAGTAGGGFYRSRNAGRAWREAGFGLPDSAVQCLAVSPAFVEDQALFIGAETAGLFRSLDGGQSWEGVGPELAGQSINCLALSPYFHATARDPRYNRMLLAGTPAGIFLSVDGGQQWTLAPNGPAAPLALALTGAGYAIAGSYQEGISLSEDGGRDWQKTLAGLAAHVPPLVVRRLGTSPSGAAELIAAAIDSGPVSSQDGGLTWQAWPVPSLENTTAGSRLPTAERFSFIGDEPQGHDGSHETGSVPVQALAAEEDVCFVATGEHLYRNSAVELGWIDLPLPLAGAKPDLLVLSPQFAESQKVLLGTQAGQLYLSEDKGEQWRSISLPSLEEAILLQAAFSFDPITLTDALNLVMAVQAGLQNFEIQLWQSNDKGANWQEMAAVSPASTPAATLLIPDPARGFPLFLAVQNEIIKLVKAPAGQTLEGYRAILAEGLYVTALAASPTYEADQTLFAATNRSVFWSQDEGVTWLSMGQGLEGRAVVALFPSPQGHLDVVTLGGEVWRCQLIMSNE